MPNELEIFYKEPPPIPPDPPEYVRLIRTEIIHSMPVKDLISWAGIPPVPNPLPDSITVELSHAF